MTKKLLILTGMLFMPIALHATNGDISSVVTSSGTFYKVEVSSVGTNLRQVVVIGNPSTTDRAPVDAVTGLKVQLATGTAEVGNVKNSGTFAVQAAQSGTWSFSPPAVTTVTFNGTGQPVTQSGTWTMQPGNTQNTVPWLVISTNTVLGTGSNTIGALTANQSVNLTQVGGASVSTGNGTSGSGTTRHTIASDNTPFGVNMTTTVVNAAGTPIVFVSTFANVAVSQTDSSLVAAVASTRLCVHAYVTVSSNTMTSVTFNSKPAGAGTAIWMSFPNGANGGATQSWSNVPYFCSNSGEGLTVTTSGGSQTGVGIVYGKE